MSQKEFKNIVTNVRKALGLNQAELGERLNGRTQITISRWETGAITPDEPEIIMLALKGLLFEANLKNINELNSLFD